MLEIPGLQDVIILFGVFAIGAGAAVIFFLLRWTYDSFKQEKNDLQNAAYEDGYDAGFDEAVNQMRVNVKHAYFHGRYDRIHTPLFDQDKD